MLRVCRTFPYCARRTHPLPQKPRLLCRAKAVILIFTFFHLNEAPGNPTLVARFPPLLLQHAFRYRPALVAQAVSSQISSFDTVQLDTLRKLLFSPHDPRRRFLLHSGMYAARYIHHKSLWAIVDVSTNYSINFPFVSMNYRPWRRLSLIHCALYVIHAVPRRAITRRSHVV